MEQVLDNLDQALGHAEQIALRLRAVIRSAHNHHLAMDATDLHHLPNILNSVSATAERHGFKVALHSAADIFQVDTSFITNGSTFHLFVHVPLVRPGEDMDIYQYVPFPVLLPGSDMALLFRPEADVLAVNRRNTNIGFIESTSAKLAT